MMALDCASARPSSSTRSGTCPAGLSARNSGVRVSDFRMSTAIHSWGNPSRSHTHFTLRQLPDLVSPKIFIRALPFWQSRAAAIAQPTKSEAPAETAAHRRNAGINRRGEFEIFPFAAKEDIAEQQDVDAGAG